MTRKAYWVSNHRVLRDAGRLAAYSKLARPAIERHGGRYIALDVASVIFEAGVRLRTVIIEFESVEKAKAAYESADYQAALIELGDGVERDVRIVEACS